MILTITTFLWYLPLKHFYCIRKIHIRMRSCHTCQCQTLVDVRKNLWKPSDPNVLDDKSVIWEHLKCFVMFWCWFDNPQLSLATYFQFCLWTVRQSRGRDGVRYVLLCQEISRFCSFWHCQSYKCHYVTLFTLLKWNRNWLNKILNKISRT